jgi:hypothetical protein
MFDEQITIKPEHLPSRELIAILGIYDLPVNQRGMSPLVYSKSELAVNERTGQVQVLVLSDQQSGIQAFKLDYPNAIIREDATLENEEDWRVLAFPTEAMPDESTPLDNFYQVVGREDRGINRNRREN